MNRPIILEGDPFDWEAGGKALLNAVDKKGRVNWWNAMSSDPGVMICPYCGSHLWHEGLRVRCPHCLSEWEPRR